jgi:hypothetical protein
MAAEWRGIGLSTLHTPHDTHMDAGNKHAESSHGGRRPRKNDNWARSDRQEGEGRRDRAARTAEVSRRGDTWRGTVSLPQFSPHLLG